MRSRRLARPVALGASEMHARAHVRAVREAAAVLTVLGMFAVSVHRPGSSGHYRSIEALQCRFARLIASR